MISVALATYNGERYIEAQLDSIRLQTRPADEVIIRDDGSTDGTSQIIERYIREHGMAGWDFQVNSKNLGYAMNFKQILCMTKGDIVFLSDQDDVWESQKIEKMVRVMEQDERILSLACAFSCIDQNGEPLAYQNPRRMYDGQVHPVSYTSFCKDFGYPGMTVALRGVVRDLYAQVTVHDPAAHDFILGTISSALDGFCFFGERLVRYRQHGNNVIGVQKRQQSRGGVEERLEQAEIYARHDRVMLDVLRLLEARGYDVQKKQIWTQQQQQFDQKRTAYLRRRSTAGCLACLPHMERYQSAKTYIGDLLYLMHLARFFK